MRREKATAVAAAAHRLDRLSAHAPGVLASATVAVAAQFLSDHYSAPAMLMALLLGIAFNFLSEEGKAVEGVEFSARTILRLGVALLGFRIGVDLIAGLGLPMLGLIVFAVTLTIVFGTVLARLLGRSWRLGMLTGGAVAICGASASMAIAAVLPRSKTSERDLIFTVLGVTLLSTAAMIAYPIIASGIGLDQREAGIFIGATIHDVAQVAGAGFSISPETGETATLVKLIRVILLAPLTLAIAFAVRSKRPTGAVGVPGFVIGFILLVILNSTGLVPPQLAWFAGECSRWALLVAVAAVGMKTRLKELRHVGPTAIILIVAETLFIAVAVLAGLSVFA